MQIRSSVLAQPFAAFQASALVSCIETTLVRSIEVSASTSLSGGTVRGLFPYVVKRKRSKCPARIRRISGYCLSDDTAKMTAFRPVTGNDSATVLASASAEGTL